MRSIISQLRRGHSTAAAYLALFAALGGSAYAATTITGKNIKDGTVTGRDVKNRSLDANKLSIKAVSFLTGRRGPGGPQGPKGDTGERGPAGPAGAPGRNAASMLTGSTTSGAIQLQGNGSQAILLPPSGILTGGNSSIQLSPNATVVARDLSVEVDTAPPPNAAIQFMFSVNGAATPLSCIVQAGATSCQNSADAVTIPPGSQITLFVDNPRPASSTATGARWGWRAMTP